jgi:flavin-dependent dehydrogenase
VAAPAARPWPPSLRNADAAVSCSNNRQFPRYHIGESLVPHTHGILDRLGFPAQDQSLRVSRKHSVRFISPDGKETTPFYFSWTIPGDGARTWQVERSLFDRMMLDHARESGVEVCEGVAVEKVLFDGQRATGVAIAMARD